MFLFLSRLSFLSLSISFCDMLTLLLMDLGDIAYTEHHDGSCVGDV
jgi:hypothetical protein